VDFFIQDQLAHEDSETAAGVAGKRTRDRQTGAQRRWSAKLSPFPPTILRPARNPALPV
jgi:hypothetical protein